MDTGLEELFVALLEGVSEAALEREAVGRAVREGDCEGGVRRRRGHDGDRGGAVWYGGGDWSRDDS